MTRERGFTLVEALVAFAILAIVLVALYGALGTSVTGLTRASNVEEALLIAESRLAELAAAKTVPVVLEGTAEGTPYRWRVQLLPDNAPEPPELTVSPLRPQRIKLIVEWPENGRRREIAIEHILLVQRPGGS